MEELEIDKIILNVCTTVNKKLNIVLPSNTSNICDYSNYLDIVLNIVKKPKIVPRSWIDESEDLKKRIVTAYKELETILANTVKGNSFGDGMPKGESKPNGEYEKQMRRIELEKEIIPKLEKKLLATENKINTIDMDFDSNVKDQVKELIEIIPNERHKDVMKQFYIYRKNYRAIAKDSFIAEETAKDYRKRGFKALTNILYDAFKKIHKK